MTYEIDDTIMTFISRNPNDTNVFIDQKEKEFICDFIHNFQSIPSMYIVHESVVSIAVIFPYKRNRAQINFNLYRIPKSST